MIRMMKIIFIFFLIAPLNSCLVKMGIPKNPCQNKNFLKSLNNYSKAELVKLARILESSSYGSIKNDGCHQALLAKIYLATDRMSKASDYFSLAAKKIPELNEYFMLAKANAEIKRQNFNLANKILTALLNSSRNAITPYFFLRVRKVLADIAVKQKDDQQIIKTHYELLEKGYSENEVLLFNLATALTNVGEYQKANEVYRRLLIYFPLSLGSKQAQKLQNLAQYNLDLTQIEKRFDKLIENLAFDQVLEDAKIFTNNSTFDDETKGQIQNLAIKSLFFNNKFEEGMSRAKSLAERINATAKNIEGYAWALAKVGHFIDAANFYDKFFQKATNKNDKAKACFFKGFSFYEASLYSMALFSWQSCKSFVQDTNYYEDYIWYQALAFLLNGNFFKANIFLKDLLRLFPNSNENEKYIYFLGYTFFHLNFHLECKIFWQRLAKKSLPSYYVLLARRSLHLDSPSVITPSLNSLLSLPQRDKNHNYQNALMLFYLGLKGEARDLILSSNESQNDKLAMLQHMGFYHDAWARSYLLKPSAVVINNKLSLSNNIRASFPAPHRNFIDQISKKYNVNKNLLYAIMRAESGFLKTAISSRGAIGLMQMMPFLAQELATRISITEFNSEHLKDPKIAIELGALWIAMLKRQFNLPHLVVAAYNAGSQQVQKWLSTFGHLTEELFVERIPFRQTRDYVKKVLPAESLYQALDGKELRLAF
jgi:soluble lytic murein transglycosylase